MTPRERFIKTMRFEPVDHVPDREFGYWDDTLRDWHEQGLPPDITDNGNADQFFGFEPMGGAPVSLDIIPGFEHRVLEEDERHRIIIDGSGVKCIVNTDGSSSIPKYLKFPVETREDWAEFKERLDPTQQRYPAPDDWEAFKQRVQDRDYPLQIGIGSLFGWLRNWMGFENVAIAAMDAPEWVEEMVEHLCTFILETIRPAVEQVQFDCAGGWEDMCFNHGCIISPRLFRAWLTPRYKRIADFLRQHGVDIVWTDCDGNINDVVEGWLDGGVNCMFPVEVFAGSDPVELRRRFGKDILLMGGVNKRALAGDKDAIRREIQRLEPLVEEGGFIPHVDHRVPPDVSYENYLYYLKTKREAFGIPEPAPWEERKPSA